MNQTGRQKYTETNGNGNTIYQNLWDDAKGVLRGKFRPINAYLKNKVIPNKQLNFTLQRVEEETEQTKSKFVRNH